MLEPGAEAGPILSALQPGDQLLLQPGRHAPLRLAGLSGTAEQPIVLRGGGRDRPGLIVGESTGIEIIGCSHLVLEDLVVHGATSTGVTIAGSKERDAVGVTLRRVIVLGPATAAAAIGVRVGVSRDVRLEQCRIERCGHASVLLDGAQGTRISDLLLAGGREASLFGVQVVGASTDGRVAGMVISGGVRYGVALGAQVDPPASAQTPEGPPPMVLRATAAPARSITVEQCIIGRCEAALLIGHVASCMVERTTIYSPRGTLMEVLKSAPPAEGPALTLRRNIFAWLPNEIATLARLPAGFEAAPILLEENLWWSEDFRDRRGDYGPFPGRETTPQVVDLNPGLDRDGRPSNEAAAGFGAG